jgi:hypothetical protein
MSSGLMWLSGEPHDHVMCDDQPVKRMVELLVARISRIVRGAGHGIAYRAGNHCGQPVMTRLNRGNIPQGLLADHRPERA